jgi:hypothetical protein
MKTKIELNTHTQDGTRLCFKRIKEWSIVLLLSAPLLFAPQAAMAQSRCAASYTIDVTVELSSNITQGGNRVMVELRQGAPGASKVFDTQYFEGKTGTVSFAKMCAGSYFIAIGNGDSVAIGPGRQFSENQSVHTRVRVTPSSGNVSTKSRRSL